MQQPTQEKLEELPAATPAIELPHIHNDGNEILVNYKGVFHIDWKSHLYWALAIICFILARLWWLVPLPGDTLLPAYRTYPANFLNTVFLIFACALATRSITVALVKPFDEGINPDSVVAFGATGGFGAMWSCIRYKSGFRYFLLAFLVTAATLLGDALEGELQSSMRVYYNLGATTDLNLAECQHMNTIDYQTASLAYSSGQISHTLSDASSLLKNHTVNQYAVSLLKTSLVPIQNISLGSTTTAAKLGRRHNQSKKCEDEDSTEVSSTSSTVSPTATENESTGSSIPSATENTSTGSSIPSLSPSATEIASIGSSISSLSHEQRQQQGQQPNNVTTDAILLNLDGEQTLLNITAAVFYNFDTSKLSVSKGENNLALPLDSTNTAAGSNNNTTTSEIKLNVLRHTTSDHKQAIIIYSSSSNGFAAGVYVSAVASNYTCQSQYCNHVGDNAANNKVVADALAEAIENGVALYGSQGLVTNILNHDNMEDKGSLADALYANSNCPQSVEIPTQGNSLYPYSAARFNLLSMLWILGYIIIWLIGAYLIGFSEETYSELARTGRMIPQIISNSANLFADGISGKTVNQQAFLELPKGKMTFHKDHNHGYSVTEEVLPL